MIQKEVSQTFQQLMNTLLHCDPPVCGEALKGGNKFKMTTTIKKGCDKLIQHFNIKTSSNVIEKSRCKLRNIVQQKKKSKKL